MVHHKTGNDQPFKGKKRELAKRQTSPAPLFAPIQPINPKASAEAWIRHRLNKAIASNYLSYSVGFKLRERDEVAAALERIERDPALRPWIDLVVLLDRSLTVWLKGGQG
jgi:hypothetical protein